MPKAFYFLAEFDGETQRRMAGYYNALREHGLTGQQTKGIPYHFTLGDLQGNEAALIARLEEICAETPVISFRIDHVGLFGLRVLFLEPCVTTELLGLQGAFFDEKMPWTPHATVLLDENPEAILRAIPLLAEQFEPFEARVESVALYEFFPARRIRRCQLQR